jgi:hypothetical protein
VTFTSTVTPPQIAQFISRSDLPHRFYPLQHGSTRA